MISLNYCYTEIGSVVVCVFKFHYWVLFDMKLCYIPLQSTNRTHLDTRLFVLEFILETITRAR